jgi:hypothetical protein
VSAPSIPREIQEHRFQESIQKKITLTGLINTRPAIAPATQLCVSKERDMTDEPIDEGRASGPETSKGAKEGPEPQAKKAGYKNPPKDHQFGNRPQPTRKKSKGTLTFAEIVAKVAAEPLKVTRRGVTKGEPGVEVGVRILRDRGLAGNQRALEYWLELLEKCISYDNANAQIDERNAEEDRRALARKLDGEC